LSSPSVIHRFGRFEVRPSERRVLEAGEAVTLGARAFDLLLVLLGARDRVVGKEELFAAVWPGLVVEENNLAVQIAALRRLLGGEAITTVPGRGYRFTLDVQTVQPSAAPAPNASASEPAQLPAAAAVPTHNLPAERSSFIGRGDELRAVARLLDTHRLVSLTGIGGTGKTRLALRAGAQRLARHADGVFFVDLAPVSEPALLAQVVARACGISLGDAPETLGGTATERLLSVLAPRSCLLLLDNCEHLIDAVAELADRVLLACPGVALLVTSREALGVEGEQVLPVAPLALPREDAPDEATDAMRLFVERARAVLPGFAPDTQSRDAVAEICRRLDGIPLAIEFAAARVGHLSPQQLAERLVDRFRLLTGGRRRIQRQQTLTAALDWSYDLLLPREQQVLQRLAAFAGDFSLAAAEGVCAGDGIAQTEVLDLLASLVAKSLVISLHAGAASITGGVANAGTAAGTAAGRAAGMRAGNGIRLDARGDFDSDVGNSETRYRMLETVRLYAADKLATAGESARVRARHRDWYLGWLQATPLEQLIFDAHTLAVIARETDNLRAAAEWSLAENRHDLLARQATRMLGHWFLNSTFREAQQWLALVQQAPLALAVEEQAACATLWGFLGVMSLDLRGAKHASDQGIALAQGLPGHDAAVWRTLAHMVRGFMLGSAGSALHADPDIAPQARRHGELALAAAHDAGLPPVWAAFVMCFRAKIEIQLGDLEAALDQYVAIVPPGREAAVAAFGYSVPDALAGIASTAYLLDRPAQALDAALRFLGLPRALWAHFGWMTYVAAEIVPALVAGGRDDLARQQLRESAHAMRRSGVPLVPNQFLLVVAVVEHLRGRPERAACLLGAARTLGGAADFTMPFRTPACLALYQHTLPRVRAALGPAEAARARDAGRAMSSEEAFAFASAAWELAGA
jgi:predicted ATPase/DNA-binding winged helix-turn-helix (wHTH) protein